ncbi:MAG TPA: pyridoxal-phosphate dependent enzyme, partial [Nitrososphaera sp.]|nr:pyridoxal-phosphate dependent enzyme [Nitrososphaera sp.]
DGSINLAKTYAKAQSHKYVMPNQYENEKNVEAHFKTTGPEIWKQTNGTVTHFLTGCGTGGTITGTATYLKEKNESVKVVAVQAQKNHLLQGLRNFEESAMPDLFKKRQSVVDEWFTATNKGSFDAAKLLAEKEGLLVGPSSGSVLESMLATAQKMDAGVLVGIFADDGRKFKSLYVREGVFTEQEYDRALKNAKHLSKLAYSLN